MRNISPDEMKLLVEFFELLIEMDKRAKKDTLRQSELISKRKNLVDTLKAISDAKSRA